MYGPLEVNVSTRALAFPSPNQTKSGFDFASLEFEGKYQRLNWLSRTEIKRLYDSICLSFSSESGREFASVATKQVRNMWSIPMTILQFT